MFSGAMKYYETVAIQYLNLRYTAEQVPTYSSTAALRAPVERADNREFIAHAARGRTRDESHSPIRGRWLSAR